MHKEKKIHLSDYANLLMNKGIVTIKKSDIYEDFFNAPFVKQYLDRHGLENPTADVRCRRVPFLFNILEALGIINQSTSEIPISKV